MAWFGWIFALLPQRFRGGYFVSTGAALSSGLIEFFACLVLFIYRYFVYYQQQTANSDLLQRAAEKGGETAVMGSGMFMLLNYVFSPITLVIIYFLVEGILRASAAIVSGEVLPTLPLAIFDLGREKKKQIQAEMALGPLVPDEIETLPTGEEELKISSCRAKGSWDHLMTVAYNEQLYEVARQEAGAPPRQFIYYLRKKPLWKIVRGIYNYSPDEVMKAD